MTGSLAVALALALTAPVPKAPAFQPTGWGHFDLVTATLVGDTVEVVITDHFFKTVEVRETVHKDGKAVEVTTPVMKQQVDQIRNKFALKDLRVVTGDGKTLTQEELAERLKTPTPMVSWQITTDPEWFKLFQADVLHLNSPTKTAR